MACPDCFGLGFTSISVTKKIKDTWYDVIGIGFFQLLSKPKSQHVKQVMLYLPSSACVRASASVYFWVPFFFFLVCLVASSSQSCFLIVYRFTLLSSPCFLMECFAHSFQFLEANVISVFLFLLFFFLLFFSGFFLCIHQHSKHSDTASLGSAHSLHSLDPI